MNSFRTWCTQSSGLYARHPPFVKIILDIHTESKAKYTNPINFRWLSRSRNGSLADRPRFPPEDSSSHSCERESIKVFPKFLASRGVAEFAKRFCLDLTDPLTGHPKLVPDLFQGSRVTIADAETEPDDGLFALGQG